ncbi:MAG: hypothetical protein U5K31_13735 [Balneolaceae bacterium]|nr:hypothetical protein [Balneolaceae bacterium]
MRYLFYKEKQLLKEGDYRTFAERQLEHNRSIFWSVSFTVFLLLAYGTWFLLEYGTEPTALPPGADPCRPGLRLAGMLLFTAREYYTIRGSMTLLIKLLDEYDVPGRRKWVKSSEVKKQV